MLGNDKFGPPSAVVIGVKRDRTVTLWSAGAQRIYGVRPEDAIGSSILELADWAITPHEVETIHLMRPGDVFAFYKTVTALDGTSHSMKTTVTVALDSDDEEELLFTSVPARRPSSFEVQPVQHFAAYSGPSALTALCNERMVIQYTSPAVQRFGFMARDLVGHASIDTVHPDDRLKWQTAWDAAVADPSRTQSVEVRRRPEGGEWRILASEITNMVDFPNVGGVVISSRDVTESRRQASAFAATEQTLRSILQNSVEGVWVVSPIGTTVFVNAYMADLLGATLATMADHSVYELLPDTVSLRAEGDGADFRRQHEFTFRRPDGQTRWIRANIVSRFDATGTYCGAILLCADITEQRHSVAYSLRAPLTAVPPADSAPSSAAAISSIMAKLSTREMAVVARLLDGDRVPTIAQTLFVSQSTVRNQLSSVFRKTQVASQQELIRLLRPARN